MAFNLSLQQPPESDQVQRFETDRGAVVYQLPLEVFPGFWAYAYLVLVGDDQVLIDTGSGYGMANEQLEARLQDVNAQVPGEVGLAQLTHVLITHGHIDHFGGLSFVRARSEAQVGVHELDLRNITNTEERLTIVARRLEQFLAESGVPEGRRRELIQLYKMSKLGFTSVLVDFTYESLGMNLGPFEFLHVPGHCAGQVVIRLHDVLFCGDHILSHISPHQSPERLVLNTGLGHYLRSLEDLRSWAGEVSLTLGGHNAPIYDLPRRIEEIKAIHRERLEKILQTLSQPHTVVEVSQLLFHDVHGYNVLLAIEEAGAHVEYLYQRGLLGIANLEELESRNGPVPIRYQRLEDSNVDTVEGGSHVFI